MDRQAADQWGDQRADAARTGRANLREPNPPMLKWTVPGFAKPCVSDARRANAPWRIQNQGK
jgi:hypothetical protein